MTATAPQRIGVFGGSFDPVHLGHLVAAQDAAEALALDRVVFVPAWQAPLRDPGPRLEPGLRLELLRAATAHDPRFGVSTVEFDRGGVSYSVDTAAALRARWPDARLFWIVGADQAERLHAWRRIEELAALAEFIVLARPGYAGAASTVPGLRLHSVAAHVFEISSTEIRRRLAEGKPVRLFLPPAVAARLERDNPFRQRMPTKRKTPQEIAARRLLGLLCRALDAKKAEDLLVLDVSKQSSITNYLVVASGTSEPHLRALRQELDRVVDETNTRVLGVEAGAGSGWTVVDAFDVMVHVLTPDNRARFRLESLWGDAPKVNWKRIRVA